jgi:hypothetical protein
LAQKRGMWVSQMIRIATPFEIRNGVNHVTQGNAITKSVQPLARILSRVALWLDTSDDPASGCDLQLFAGLNSLEVGGKVLPQIGYGDADHSRRIPLYKAIVHGQADARQDAQWSIIQVGPLWRSSRSRPLRCRRDPF